MPTYYARASGNVNAANVWATTPTGAAGDFFPSFTNADVLVANSFTVTLNVNTTVAEIRNDATGGATAGGGFALASGVTLNANGFSGTSTATLVNYSATSGSAIVNGNFTCVGGAAFLIGGIGTLNLTGSVTGGTTATSVHGIFFNNAAVLNITGNISGGSTSSSNGIYVAAGGGTINITGNVTGGIALDAHGISVIANVTINITGNVTGGAGGRGIMTNSGLLASATVVGVATGGTGRNGIENNGFGVFTVTRAKGSAFGPGSSGLSATHGITAVQTGITRVSEIEYGDRGQTPVSGPIQFIDSTSNVALFFNPLSAVKKTLADPAATANLLPAAANVRRGVAYAAGSVTGACAMPDPRSVDYGVAVGSTTGTAILTPAGAFAIPAANLATSNSIGQRARSVATVADVGNVLVGAA